MSDGQGLRISDQRVAEVSAYINGLTRAGLSEREAIRRTGSELDLKEHTVRAYYNEARRRSSESLKCPDCGYMPRADAIDKEQALRMHRQRAHEGMQPPPRGRPRKAQEPSHRNSDGSSNVNTEFPGFRVIEGMILLERVSDGAIFLAERIR